MDYGWVEVMHRTFVVAKSTFVNTLEHDGLWLYRARGSGVWYRTGRTFSVSDLADLGIWLAATGSELGKHAGTTRYESLQSSQLLGCSGRKGTIRSSSARMSISWSRPLTSASWLGCETIHGLLLTAAKRVRPILT